MAVSKFARSTVAIALAAGISTGLSAQAADLPCGHPNTPATAEIKVRIDTWKEPLLVEEFKKFGRQGEFFYFDGPYYVPVEGKPTQPKAFKYWQIQKAFESPAHFIALNLSNAPGDNIYTLQVRHCATATAWEPIWKTWMDVVDSKVGVEVVK